jgi:hypothetical protein
VTRDLRDPLQFGMAYLQARKGGVPIDVAVLISTPRYRSDESCIEKYGSPNDLKPKWMEVQVK